MSSISEILINFMKRGGKFVLFSEDLRKKISHSFSLTDTECTIYKENNSSMKKSGGGLSGEFFWSKIKLKSFLTRFILLHRFPPKSSRRTPEAQNEKNWQFSFGRIFLVSNQICKGFVTRLILLHR